MALVVRALVRDLLRHPWQVVLVILSIAAGVTVVVGVDIANGSAMAEFQRASRIMDGGATHRLTGGTRDLDERIYRRVRVDAGIMAAAPVISARVAIEGDAGEWSLMGIDPLSDFRLRGLKLGDGESGDVAPGATPPPWPIFVSADAPLPAAGEVVLIRGDRRQTFQLAGGLEMPGESGARLLVTDIAWAQDFLAMKDRISHIDLRLGPGDAERLAAVLPPEVRLVDLAIHHGAREDMSAAFRTNLTALSLLALVVAMFLVYSTVSFQVIRRRRLIGLLGAAGVTGGAIGIILLVELLLVGLAGSALGILLGGFLANLLTALVSGTIDALYHTLAQPAPTLSTLTLSRALLVGVAACVASGFLPIWAMSRQAPVRLLRGGAALIDNPGTSRLLLPASAVFSLVAATLILWPARSLAVPFAGLFLLICALSLLAPWMLRRCTGLGAVLPLTRPMLVTRMALGNAGRHLDRTGVAVAALAVAVSATLGVEMMIQSFRHSVDDWLQHYLRADIYLSASGSTGQSLAPEFIDHLGTLPALRHLSTGRRVALDGPAGPLTVFALDVPAEGFAGFQLIDRLEGDTWQRFHDQGGVLISEPFARRSGLAAGDGIELPTDRGQQGFSVAGVYRDYSSDRGLVTMDWRTWRRYFDDDRRVSAALYLEPGTDIPAVMERIRAHSAAPAGLFLRSNRGLRDATMTVFDQTFRITAVLRWLAVIVAVVGILTALMALLLDRRREFGMLSAIGFSRWQVGRLLVWEAGLAGFAAGIVAVPLGMLLSLTLIRVINVRSFGWSMASRVDWQLAAQSVLLAVAAAMAAAIYPAWRFRDREILGALRDE